MNVPNTQHSLFRQLDAVGIVAPLQQAAELAQKQLAISSLREAQHRENSIDQTENAHLSPEISDRAKNRTRQRNNNFYGSDEENEQAGTVKDAPNITTLGHHFDIIA